MPCGTGAAAARPVTHGYGVICVQGELVRYALRLQDLYPLLFFLLSVVTRYIHVKVCTCSEYEQAVSLSAVLWHGVN